MDAADMLFTDLPGEMRNLVYEHYLGTVDKSTVSVASGLFLPPPLARASSQIRKAFMPCWLTHDHDLAAIEHVKAQVIDFDFQHLMAWSNRVCEVTKRSDLFKTMEIRLIFTESCLTDNSKAKLREWADWVLQDDGFLLIEEGLVFVATFDWDHIDVVDAFLPSVSNEEDKDDETDECLFQEREAVDLARRSRRLELGLGSEVEDSDLE